MSDTNSANSKGNLSRLYFNRFTDAEKCRKDQVWRVLCSDFFQRYVRSSDIVLDLGVGSANRPGFLG